MRTGILILCLLCVPLLCNAGVKNSKQESGAVKINYSSSLVRDSARINYLIKSGFLNLGKKNFNPEKTGAYIDSVLTIYKKEGVETPPLLDFLQSEYFFSRGDYSASEEQANKTIRKAENLKDYEILAKALLFLGRYNHLTGFYKESLDSYNKSIQVAQENKLKRIVPKAYDGLANVFNTVKDLKGYRKNLELMIHASLAEGDSLSAESGLSRLGTSFTDVERNSVKADSLLRKCMEISLVRKDSMYTSLATANLGWNYYIGKMYDSSIFYYKKSLNYSLPSKNHGTSGNSFGNLGTIYRDLGDYDRALDFYSKSIAEAHVIKDWYGLSWVYNDMSQLYLSTKDTARAFKVYVLYKKFNDSLLLSQSNQGLMNARIRYEADTHNKEMALLSLRLKNNRTLNLGFTGLIILTITIALLLVRSAKIDARRRISEMNHKISEVTQANLRQQMNPHFIFNTLNSIQYYMYQHDKLATNNYLTKFSSLMRKVLENSQHTSVPLRDEIDALNLYLELECLRFKDKFSYSIKVDEEIDQLLFKVPTMLIQPYVENSICHGLMPLEGKGEVRIEIKLQKDHLTCIIKDNGIGREAASERNRMKSEANHNSLGTRIVSSRLDLVNALYGTSLKTIYTDLKNEKGEPEGTMVEIHIPILT